MRPACILLLLGVVLAGGCAKTMKLSTDTNTMIENPSKKQIRAVLIDVASRPADGFVIVGESEMTYMQAAGDTEKRFWIEHQEGSLARHFHAESRISIEETTEILASYARKGGEWKSATKWIPDPVR